MNDLKTWTPCHPQCPGWAVFNDTEIQRCDECARFASDADAVEFVRSLESPEPPRVKPVNLLSQSALEDIRDQIIMLHFEALEDQYTDTGDLWNLVGHIYRKVTGHDLNNEKLPHE